MARMVGERGMAESAEAEGRMFPRTAPTPMTTIPMGMEVETPLPGRGRSPTLRTPKTKVAESIKVAVIPEPLAFRN